MGNVKKAVKKRPVKKNGRNGNGTAALGRLQEALDLVRNTGESYIGLLESVHPKKDNVTQQQMESALVLDAIIEAAKHARGKFDVEALSHHGQRGSFETGRVAITFPLTAGRRSTKWKDVAVDKAQELAESIGADFGAENFDTEIKADARYTTVGEDKVKVKLTVSAG